MPDQTWKNLFSVLPYFVSYSLPCFTSYFLIGKMVLLVCSVEKYLIGYLLNLIIIAFFIYSVWCHKVFNLFTCITQRSQMVTIKFRLKWFFSFFIMAPLSNQSQIDFQTEYPYFPSSLNLPSWCAVHPTVATDNW